MPHERRDVLDPHNAHGWTIHIQDTVTRFTLFVGKKIRRIGPRALVEYKILKKRVWTRDLIVYFLSLLTIKDFFQNDMNVQSAEAKSFYQKPRFKENRIMQLMEGMQ